MTTLRRTDLFELHEELGAKMVPFAGWEMPVQYPMGVMKEHLACRAGAGLFDVGHMGQVILRSRTGAVPDVARALERLVPMDILGLAEGRQRYAFFTNDGGGILDDLMVANRGDHLFLVVNAARAEHDVAHLAAGLGDDVSVEPVVDRGLMALQGPKAETVLDQIVPGVAAMRFMDVKTCPWDGAELWISRSGYTGEDGYEISVPADKAAALARRLLDLGDVAPIGLGARDSLRLEAGLCLYGSDIDENSSPVEAGLTWAIQKSRRRGGAREGGFPGAVRILNEIEDGASLRRVGLRPEGRAPMRAGTLIYTQSGSEPVGEVTSGGFGPSVEAPVSMAYLAADQAAPGAQVFGEVRGKRLPAEVVALPFRQSNFKR